MPDYQPLIFILFLITIGVFVFLVAVGLAILNINSCIKDIVAILESNNDKVDTAPTDSPAPQQGPETDSGE